MVMIKNFLKNVEKMAVEIKPFVNYYLELKSIFTSWIMTPLRVAFVAAGVFFIAENVFCKAD